MLNENSFQYAESFLYGKMRVQRCCWKIPIDPIAILGAPDRQNQSLKHVANAKIVVMKKLPPKSALSLKKKRGPSGVALALQGKAAYQFGTAKHTSRALGTVYASVLASHTRAMSHTERQTLKHAAKQLAHIIGSPITADQRARAQELVDQAKRASESDVTAKFRRLAHAA